MSRNTGTFNFAANFEGLSKAPIDAKQLVGTYADLTTTATWCGSGSVWLYNGAMVVVGSDPTPANNGIYWLCDANNYTMTCAWKKAGSGSGGSGTLTGATNGLHLQYSGTSVALGGTVTQPTTITLSGGSAGLTFTDNRVGVNQKGIEYGADYSGTFVPESLITKRYADAIVSGLKPKQAVKVATTAHIVLSGLITIDGITLTTGDRVLVKNQSGTTAAAANGIYSASTGTWGRTEDFDGTSIGEVVSGSYTWVLSGNTNQNTSWVLVTSDPIIVGVTPMSFVYFNHIQDITSGTGITVTMNGGNSVISINSAYQSEIHSSLTGSTGSGIGISGRNVCLNSSTIAILNSAITGATNGLCKYDSHNVCLGGKLYGYTTIDLNGNILTICDASGHAFIKLNDSSTSACFGTNISGAVTELRSGCYDLTLGNASGSAYFQDFDSITPRGIQYNSDYSCTFCNNSLITKKYVDTTILASGATSISARNGLTKQGNIIILGGTITGATTINTGVNDFNICGTCGNLRINNNGAYVSGSTVELRYDNIHKLVVNGSGTGFDGPVLFVCTATYFQDESGTYSCLSIPNVGWVTGQTSTSGIQTANNGLSKNGSNVVLGGTLTGTTAIIQAGNTFSICTTSAGVTPIFEMDSGNFYSKLGTYCNATRYSNMCSCDVAIPTTGIYSCNGTCWSNVFVDTKVSLNTCNGTLSCGTTVCLNENGLYYGANYCSRWNNCRYIPDINYVTGYTNTAVACCSNVDTVCQIISSYTTVPTDNFIGVCGATLVCLLNTPTPKYGQRVTVADISGNALIAPILICGGIYLINNCYQAQINTDYGSITFIFNCNNFWSAIAFVN